MFWDKISGLYDLFENIYNGKVYRGTGKTVADEIETTDEVLECACGTGAISVYIAPKCRRLTATDFSKGMLKRAEKKLKSYSNTEVLTADIMKLQFGNESFDKVVAGNVIHLLDDPYAAIDELMRVCRKNGKVIIPTYINIYKGRPSRLVKLFEKAGASFKRQFDLDSYKAFFRDAGYENAEYHVVEGKMPCAVAVIKKRGN